MAGMFLFDDSMVMAEVFSCYDNMVMSFEGKHC